MLEYRKIYCPCQGSNMGCPAEVVYIKKLNNSFYPGKQPPDITMTVTRYSPIQEIHYSGIE
jgi:hypothetical protein